MDKVTLIRITPRDIITDPDMSVIDVIYHLFHPLNHKTIDLRYWVDNADYANAEIREIFRLELPGKPPIVIMDTSNG